LATLVEAERQFAAHAIDFVGAQGGVEDARSDLDTVGEFEHALRIGPGTPEFFQGGIEGHAAQGIPVQVFDVLEVAFRDDAAIGDEQAGSKPVMAELRDQIPQGTSIVHVAVEDFVEQREAFLLRDGQPDLDERPAFHPFLIFSQLAQRAASA